MFWNKKQSGKSELSLKGGSKYAPAYLSDAMIDGLWVIDLQGKTIDVNSAMAKMLGYDRTELLKKNPADVAAKESLEVAAKTVRESLQGKVSIGEANMLKKDGTKIPVSLVATAMRDAEGKAIGGFAVIRDITEQKQTEEALIREGNFLSAIIENQPGMVWFKDKEGKFLAVNKKFAHGCGYKNTQDVVGKTDFDVWPKELAEKYRADDEKVMREKKSFRDEELIEDKGNRKWYETFKTPVIDSSGEILGTSGFAQDITERKKAEDALKFAKEQAEAANKYKTEFLTNISHDLRTPLHSIIGFSDTLKSVALEEKYHKGVIYINQKARHLLAMVEEILSVSKMESGKIELKCEKFDLYKLLESSIEAARGELGQKDVRISLEAKGTIPPLKGDVFRVQQVIDNLLSNAVKYTTQGQIQVTVALDMESSQSDKYQVKISVKDTGIGIPVEKLPHVFESFTRFHEFYEGKSYDGVGLGLYIVKRIAVVMGGDILVSSEVGRGSEFILTLKFDKV